MEFDIVAFGKEVFDRFHETGDLQRLRQDLESVDADIDINGWSVLMCYCETEKEPCLLLCEIEWKKLIAEYRSGVSPKLTGMSLSIWNYHALSFDYLFKTDEFSKLFIKIAKEILASNWEEILKEIESLPSTGKGGFWTTENLNCFKNSH